MRSSWRHLSTCVTVKSARLKSISHVFKNRKEPGSSTGTHWWCESQAWSESHFLTMLFLTPSNGGRSGGLRNLQISKESYFSWPCWQQPTFRLYSGPMSFILPFGLLNDLFPGGFPTQISHALFIFPCVLHTLHFSFLVLSTINLIDYLRPPATFSLSPTLLSFARSNSDGQIFITPS